MDFKCRLKQIESGFVCMIVMLIRFLCCPYILVKHFIRVSVCSPYNAHTPKVPLMYTTIKHQVLHIFHCVLSVHKTEYSMCVPHIGNWPYYLQNPYRFGPIREIFQIFG